MNTSERLRQQWKGYARYHRSRTNLIFHIVLVPLFVLSNISLVRALLFRSPLFALLAIAGMFLSIAFVLIATSPFTGVYAPYSGTFVTFVAGLIHAPIAHRIPHRFNMEETES